MMLQVKYSVSGSSCTSQHLGQNQSQSIRAAWQPAHTPACRTYAATQKVWLLGSCTYVEGLTLNLKCTSTNQSTRIARIFSLMSVCRTGQVSPAQLHESSVSMLHTPYLLCHVARGHPVEGLNTPVVAVDLAHILSSCAIVQAVIKVQVLCRRSCRGWAQSGLHICAALLEQSTHGGLPLGSRLGSLLCLAGHWARPDLCSLSSGLRGLRKLSSCLEGK